MKKFKKINKLVCLIIAFLLASIQVITPTAEVKAKTLRDLKNELAEKEASYNENKHQKELTEAQIAEVNENIVEISREKDEIDNEVIQLSNEIYQLEKDIALKNEEIKNILSYYQVTAYGDAAYLEYLFKSKDFTDFIYRLAVAEQLSSYNSRLIDDYNNLITQNEEKKEELAERKEELRIKQIELEDQLVILGENRTRFMDAVVSDADEIEALREYIEVYETQYHCQDDDDLDTCTRDQLPPGTAFYRPTEYGIISADFGPYNPFGYWTQHYGIDITGNYLAPVYATANGKVAAIISRANCGGNMIFIHHYVNGVTYTSGYEHLAEVYVSVGDTVTYNTVIGLVGGSRNEYWDSCSTGSHLHFQISSGLYYENYYSYGEFDSHALNPHWVLNIPYEGYRYSDRTTRY